MPCSGRGGGECLAVGDDFGWVVSALQLATIAGGCEYLAVGDEVRGHVCAHLLIFFSFDEKDYLFS